MSALLHYVLRSANCVTHLLPVLTAISLDPKSSVDAASGLRLLEVDMSCDSS